MKSKKFLSMLCAAALVFGAAASPLYEVYESAGGVITANAEIDPDPDAPQPDIVEYFTDGDFSGMKVNEGGQTNVWIDSYFGNDVIVTIPSELRGCKVTRICSTTFDHARGGDSDTFAMTTLNIPLTVNCIEAAAFGQHTNNLTTVNVGENPYFEFTGGILYAKDVTKICGKKYGGNEVKKSVIKCCSQDKYITIPSGVTTIEWNAFDGCENLEHIVLPTTLTAIGGYAFNGCLHLQEVEVPYGTTYLGQGAFAACWALGSVKLPASLVTISNYAFQFCYALSVIRIPPSVKYMGFGVFEGNETEVIYEGGKPSTDEPDVPSVSPITSATLTLSKTSYTYDGTEKKPAVTVKNGSDILSPSTDYNVSYKDNVNAGTAKVTVTGKGKYSGSVSQTFTISKKNLSDVTISGVKNKYYTGKAIKLALTLKQGTKTLKEGTDYTLTYKNNKAIGTATVTLKGKGNYTGTVSKTFKICPKKTAIKKLTSPKTKQLKVTYNKVSGVTGYQVTYSTSPKFTKKTTKSTNASGTSKTITKLTKGKTYYVKVRTYKTVKGTKYYSGYTAVKKVKVK